MLIELARNFIKVQTTARRSEMKLNSFETDDTVRNMLKKLSTLWKSRAAVNQDLPDYWDIAFDPSKKDFSVSLLPFRNHQAWQEAPEDLQNKCLSYAWGI